MQRVMHGTLLNAHAHPLPAGDGSGPSSKAGEDKDDDEKSEEDEEEDDEEVRALSCMRKGRQWRRQRGGQCASEEGRAGSHAPRLSSRHLQV